MKNLLKKLTLFLLVLPFSIAYAQVSPNNNVQFLSSLKDKKWDMANSLLTTNLKKKINAIQLQQLFESLRPRLGAFESFKKEPIKKDHDSTFYIGKFSNASLVIHIITNDSLKIAGFFFKPLSQLYALPSYADTTKYTTIDTFINSAEIRLPSIITVPKKNLGAKIPVIIFIGGSGPSDKDESTGVLKPFKDISIGLAVNNIASLRFDKRTLQYLPHPEKITVEEEYYIDVKNAISLAKTIKNVDLNKIYIIGHSLGGMLAPIILQKNPELAGAILLEASSRPMEDLILEQSAYLNKIDSGNVSKAQLNLIENEVSKVKTIKESDSTKIYFNIPGYYWLSLKSQDPIFVAKQIKQQSIFIIQGGSDYQVTEKDYSIWRKELTNSKNVRFMDFPKINHAIMEANGVLSPDQYNQPGNVPYYIIAKLSEYINTH